MNHGVVSASKKINLRLSRRVVSKVPLLSPVISVITLFSLIFASLVTRLNSRNISQKLLCLLQPTANYDLAIIEDNLAGNAKIKISIIKKNGVVVIFGEPWQLLLTGSAVPRIAYSKAIVNSEKTE